MVLGKLDSHMQKNKTGLLSHTIYKNKLQMVKDLNVKPETLNLLEENIGSKLFDIGLSNIFLDRSLQARETKAKINKWDYSNLKAFAQQKKPSTK